MSDFVATMAALRSHLEVGFTALPLYWPNGDAEPSLASAPNGFVYSEGRVLAEGPVTIGPDGTRTHRDDGDFTVTVYVPAGTLVGAAEGHAQSLRTLFGVNSGSGVRIKSRTIGQGQHVNGPLGRFWAVPVVIMWQSDRIE